MTLFDHYPVYADATNHIVAGQPLWIAAYSLAVEVSLTATGLPCCPAGASRFPAVIDTGHSHNFSIRQIHLETFAKLEPKDLVRLPSLKVTDASGIPRSIAAFDAEMWLHPRRPDRDALRLEIDGGFTCYRYTDAIPGPRYPLIGSRLLATAELLLEIDYRHLIFSIHTPP